MKRMSGSMIAMLALLGAATADAQSATVVAGDTVRITSESARLDRAEGIVLGANADTLRVAVHGGAGVAIPSRLVSRVDVQRGQRASRPAVAGGILVGIVIGGAVGGRTVHVIRSDDCSCLDGVGPALVGVAVGAIVGGTLGGWLGSRKRVPRWVPGRVF